MKRKVSLFILACALIALTSCAGPPPGERPAAPPTQPPQQEAPEPQAEQPEPQPEVSEPEPEVVEEPEPLPEPEIEVVVEVEEDVVAEPEEPAAPVAVEFTDAWLLNTSGETSPVFDGALVNIESVTLQTINGVDYQCITASGIPNYETEVTQNLIDNLNGRPQANQDFANGTTTLTLNDVAEFGADIGYSARAGCTAPDTGYGYWPPGPVCPDVQTKTQCFPMDPQPTTEACETGLGSIGTWINGVSIYNWGDGQSYNNQRVWQNTAPSFEIFDLDICVGHAANGDYHHHGAPLCLIDQLAEAGDAHSQIYGFAADGYPVYGPWDGDGVLAESCWMTRDYDDPNSPTGCGVSGERSCVLVDPYDISKGTEPAASIGPRTDEVVTSLSGNSFVATPGYYFEDYYYDPACTAQGGQYLDQYNGHDHDGLGYHYHVTADFTPEGGYTDVFPYYIGPEFAGALQANGILSCGGGAGPGGGGPPGGDGGAPPEGGGGEGGPPEGGQGGLDLTPVAESLGVSVAELEAAIGGPPPDFQAAAAALGVSVQEIEAAFQAAGLGGP